MSDDIITEITEKEKELTKQEEALDIVEAAILGFEHEITLFRIERDGLGLKVKEKELKINELMPDYKKAKHTLGRFRRELDALKRTYFRQREMR